MSFWPFCCKSPQTYPVNIDAGVLSGQFCGWDESRISGRPKFADALGVAGSRSGRVVDNPLTFKSVCGVAGVTEDGRLFYWGADAVAVAARYRHSSPQVVAREYGVSSGSRGPGFRGLYQIGSDTDWNFVADGGDETIAVKQDGRVWTLGGIKQAGVDQGINGTELLYPAFRAILNSPIVGFRPTSELVQNADGFPLASTRYGLPVWFTQDPAGAVQLKKLRFHHPTNAFRADVAEAIDEPGAGAAVSSTFRAKINDGAILGGVVTAPGSGYPKNTTLSLAVEGHDRSGSGAVVHAVTDANGAISSVFVASPGEGYRNPVKATVYGSGAVSITPTLSVKVVSGGSGYKSVPELIVRPRHDDDSPDAVENAAAIRVSKMSKCGVGGFEVVSGGEGYTSATATEVRTGARATAVVNEDGVIVSWTLTHSGDAVFSPLDSEPLVADVTGDGEGAEAAAIPVGSSIEEVEVTSNPEVWEQRPTVEVRGDGEDADVVIEGIIGRLAVEATASGSGYTKTADFASESFHDFRRMRRDRTLYCPCATASSAHAVGGLKVGGDVIVAEAVLGPSEIKEIKQDAGKFTNPLRGRTGEGRDDPDPNPPDEDKTLREYHYACAGLTVHTSGVLNPFDFIAGVGGNIDVVPEEERADYVAATIRAYIRGPGHQRYPVSVQYAPGTLNDVRLRLEQSIPMPQPPALVVEFLSRPHKQRIVFYEDIVTTSPQDGEVRGCWAPTAMAFEPVEGAPSWWADVFLPIEVVVNYDAGHFVSTGGDVEVEGETGSLAFYKVIDGRLILERQIPVPERFPWGDPPNQNPTASVLGDLDEYRGPLREDVIFDPMLSWSKPSAAQRVHFIYPTEIDSPARGRAEVILHPVLEHPAIGDVTLAENGRYTEEPEPLIFLGVDPVPEYLGLTDCTSAGRGDYSGSYAVVGGKLMWWGRFTSITDNSNITTVPPEFGYIDDEGDPKKRYENHLKRAGLRERTYTARPEFAGGHLRFSISGSRASEGTAMWDFLRLPRPDYGNRCVSFVSDVFDVRHGESGIAFLHPGTYISGESLLRYRPWQLKQMDHGAGYEQSAGVEYRGPGLHPHSVTLSAQVIPNGITAVGKNGLLKDSAGKWRIARPIYTPFEMPPPPLETSTVLVTQVPRFPCGFVPWQGQMATVYAASAGPQVVFNQYLCAAKTAGRGYRQSQGLFGGGHFNLKATGQVPFLGMETDDLGEGNYRARFVRDSRPAFPQVRGETSTYGGLADPASFMFYSDVPPSLSIVDGTGTGATLAATPLPQRRWSVFPPLTLDPLISSEIEPWYDRDVDPQGQTEERSYAIAATTEGELRFISSTGAVFLPEAFEGFPKVTRITGSGGVFPYRNEGTPRFMVRDESGRLWVGGMSGKDVFLDGGGLARPRLLAPLAIALKDVGKGYDYPATVSVNQPSGVATGSVTIDGRVVGLAVTDGGSGYEEPPDVFVGSASARATIAGPVWKVTVDHPGQGYRCPPRVVFVGSGVPAKATSFIDEGKVTGVRIDEGGLYRQRPTVRFEPDADVEEAVVENGGRKYSSPPTVLFTGGGGSGASGVAKISCEVTEIILGAGGSGYITPPLVEIIANGPGSGAEAVASLDPNTGQITGIRVTSPGSGYDKPPQVRIVSRDTTGGGAVAVSKIEGFVSEIELVTRGSGYDWPPTVIVTGGGGEGASARAVLGRAGGGASGAARINGSVIAAPAPGGGGTYSKPPEVRCVRKPPQEDAPPESDAKLKSVILGRPTAVTVSNGGSDYCSPFYADQGTQLPPAPPKIRRRSPSRPVRRTQVYAKGSFCLNRYFTSGRLLPSVSENRDFGPISWTKFGIIGAHQHMNTIPLLGVASIAGETEDNGGSVGSVLLPRLVVRLRVTSPGTGYTPGTLVPIVFKGGGTRDNRFRILWDNEWGTGGPSVGEEVASAYVGPDGKVAGVAAYQLGPIGLPGGTVAYTSPPSFEISGGGGTGAVVEAELDHPLECYYAPEALFDGHIEVEADTALTLAGAVVEGDGTLPLFCAGTGPASPHWFGGFSTFSKSKLFSSSPADLLRPSGDKPACVRLRLEGKIAGFAPITSTSQWSDEEKAYLDKPVAFFRADEPPEIVIEDETGTEARFPRLELGSSGALTVKAIGEHTILSGGSGYTLASRIRLVGGIPRAGGLAATARVSPRTGRVMALDVTNMGAGYTRPPSVFIVGDGAGAEAIVEQSNIDPKTGKIARIRLLSGGRGYTSATVVVVHNETVAEESPAVTGMLDFIAERYSVVLEDAKVTRAEVPGELRRTETTVGVRSNSRPNLSNVFDEVLNRYLSAAGVRLHPVYLSDGFVEYVRLEHHFQDGIDTASVTVTDNSGVTPERPAAAEAVVPKCGPLFSPGVAHVTTGGADFPHTQFD